MGRMVDAVVYEMNTYQYRGHKLVEENNLNAAHSQSDTGVHNDHVRIGVPLRCIHMVNHAEIKHLLIRDGHCLHIIIITSLA